MLTGNGAGSLDPALHKSHGLTPGDMRPVASHDLPNQKPNDLSRLGKVIGECASAVGAGNEHQAILHQSRVLSSN